MENQEKKSKWDELARELGADAPPEPVAAPFSPAPAQTGHDEPPRRKAAADRPPARPKANPMGWDSLAADLGIQPPPSPPPAPPPAPSRTVTESAPEREAVSKRAAAPPPRRPRPPAPAKSDDGAETQRRPVRPARPSREEPREPAPEPAAEPEAKPAPPGMGVSLWHKIFGSPDEQAQRIAEIARPDDEESRVDKPREEGPREERHGRYDRTYREEQTGEPDVELEPTDTWREEPADVPSADADVAEENRRPTMDEEGEPRRRRGRRRGRGRGRGRRPDSEQGVGERTADRSEGRSPGPREPRERGRSGRPRRDDDARKIEDPKDDLDGGLEEIVLDDDDADDLDLGADADVSAESSGRELPPGHRSIPSWEEAIGMIVDTNLATRPDRRRSSPPSRGSGQSRGRSRGGRRRKKS